MFLLLIVFTFGVLVGCWVWGDMRIQWKCLITLVYITSWGLAYIPFHSLYLFPLAQVAFALGVGGWSFGIDWLMRDVTRKLW